MELLEQHIAFDWAALDKHRKRLRMQEEDNAVYLVAWHVRLPIGHAFVKWDGPIDHPIVSRLDGCPDVEDLFVSPNLRSRGVGSRLLDAAERLVNQKGYSQIGLGVDAGNARARALYNRRAYKDAGFEEYTIRWQYVDRDGKEQWAVENCNYLIKRL